MLIDSHCHFDAFAAEGQVPAVLERAAAAGVQRLLAIGGSPAANALAVRLAGEYPQRLRAVVGYDRDQAPQAATLPALEPLFDARAVVAVGEIGLDYYYHLETADAQKQLFAQMLALARTHRLPVVVHSRYADRDTLSLLGEHAAQWPGDPARLGVVHCFTGEAAFAEALLQLGLHLSFSGIVTFRNADALRAVAATVPAERLLVETDSPYLTPMPFRGERNEPARVLQVAECLARVRQTSVAEIAALTTRNAETLFALEAHET